MLTHLYYECLRTLNRKLYLNILSSSGSENNTEIPWNKAHQYLCSWSPTVTLNRQIQPFIGAWLAWGLNLSRVLAIHLLLSAGFHLTFIYLISYHLLIHSAKSLLNAHYFFGGGASVLGTEAAVINETNNMIIFMETAFKGEGWGWQKYAKRCIIQSWEF